jgi:hypothetical protein
VSKTQAALRHPGQFKGGNHRADTNLNIDGRDTGGARLATPSAQADIDIEEKGAADPKRARGWVPIEGRFGGGTYFVNSTSPTDIVVRAEIMLIPTGTGTANDVKAITGTEDAIGKAVSTKGYRVDLKFVDVASPYTFKVNVDPCRWEVATNWSGGDPRGFAHELHHLFAFELDRYNDIGSHATNQSMEVAQRLEWFEKELSKPAGFNDPTSIMDSAPHPNESDVCTVAGLDVKTCVAAGCGKSP